MVLLLSDFFQVLYTPLHLNEMFIRSAMARHGRNRNFRWDKMFGGVKGGEVDKPSSGRGKQLMNPDSMGWDLPSKTISSPNTLSLQWASMTTS